MPRRGVLRPPSKANMANMGEYFLSMFAGVQANIGEHTPLGVFACSASYSPVGDALALVAEGSWRV
jgi:hypothetical protein